mgnify:CR=1 FL=1
MTKSRNRVGNRLNVMKRSLPVLFTVLAGTVVETQSGNDGWGWTLSPIDAGILRARNGGISVLTTDGSSFDMTVPNQDRIDRQLFISPFVDPPAIEFRGLDVVDVSTISPPDQSVTDDIPAVDVMTQTSGLPLIVVIGGLLLAGLGVAAIAQEFRNWRSRRA